MIREPGSPVLTASLLADTIAVAGNMYPGREHVSLSHCITAGTLEKRSASSCASVASASAGSSWAGCWCAAVDRVVTAQATERFMCGVPPITSPSRMNRSAPPLQPLLASRRSRAMLCKDSFGVSSPTDSDCHAFKSTLET